jgi:hypothetical protein
MAFNISLYIASLARSLRQMPHRYRSFFSMWCFHAMLSRYDKALDMVLEKADKEFVFQSFDLLWGAFISNTEIPKEVLAEIGDRCVRIEPRYDDSLGHVLFLEIISSLPGVINVFESGDAEEAASMAEHFIDCICGELGSKLGRSPSLIGDGDISSYPEIRHELESQRCILIFLETLPALSASDLNRCRSRAP